ncbi:MAG TPA: aldo/keto reductase [Candidatus Acidoferrum sp.]|nr:aldo/keto reductase [Candidatus Acidoferrum sp.]
MNYRRFGRTGWRVSEIGYGMWGLAEWSGSDDTETLQSLYRAIELGCNFFDTAWAYGDGKSEQILAKVLREKKYSPSSGGPDRHLYVATKIPPRNRRWPSTREFTLDDCYPPDYVEEYIERSLKNLGVDTIDLMQFHTWEDRWLNDERLPRSIENMKKSGKVRAVGPSINRWEPANGLRMVLEGYADAVQAIYNIFDQNPEDALLPICAMKEVGFIARVPFDEGTLTGTLTLDSKWSADDWRSTYFVPENLNSSVEHAEALRPVIPSGMTMAELALRFILSNKNVSTIIPGMRKMKNVQANVAASDAGPLPAELHRKLRAHRWDRNPTPWSQ